MADLPDFFGLDIGNHSIKVAQVKRQGEGKATLSHVGSVPSDFGLLENDSDEGIAELAELVKQARDVAGISVKNCVAAVPEAPVFSRLLSIPPVEEDKLEEAIHWELKNLIPVPLEDVDVAFLKIGTDADGEKANMDIYVVAAPRAMTDRFKKVAEAAGLNLLALETESLASTRNVTFNHKEETDIMITDFGAYGTDLVIAKNGIPVFAQTISTGSDALTKAIAADYGLDLEQAEKYKRAYGLLQDQGEGKIAKTIEPLMQLIVGEMSKMLTYYKQRIGHTGAQKIYLSGDAAQLPGLILYFSKKLGIPAVLVQPLNNIQVAGSAKKEVEQLSMVGFTVAIGLGLKNS